MKLENNLTHQINAVNAVCGVFAGAEFIPATDKNTCAKIDLTDSAIHNNIKKVQSGHYYVDGYSLPEYYCKNASSSEYLNILFNLLCFIYIFSYYWGD